MSSQDQRCGRGGKASQLRSCEILGFIDEKSCEYGARVATAALVNADVTGSGNALRQGEEMRRLAVARGGDDLQNLAVFEGRDVNDCDRRKLLRRQLLEGVVTKVPCCEAAGVGGRSGRGSQAIKQSAS